MNRNAIIAFSIVALLSLFLLFGMPSINSSWFQFPRNYNINNNSRNWANHEYGYNLMMNAEPNSIFMTEGGDNQVFSLLYFATAERMRPDIDFFDQKGNVFPRLYGDLLNTSPPEIALIRDIRDFQLFSTGRPIYLTWQRKNIEKLNINSIRFLKSEILKKMSPNQQNYFKNKYRLDTLEQLKATARGMVPKSVYNLALRSGGNLADQDFRYMGPWYFKNFGMVFRVTPLRYAIVDALESLNGKGDFTSISAEVTTISKIAMISNQFFYYVNQLQEEGYVKKESETIVLLKPFRASFDHIPPIEYWEHYKFSYLNVPNANNWDFLTREIFANNVRMLDFSVNFKISSLRKKLSLIDNNEQKKEVLNEMNRWAEKLVSFRKTIPIYNYDNPGMTYPYAIQVKNENKPDEAKSLYVLTARANYRFNGNFLQAINILLNKAEIDPENQQKLLTEARGYLTEFYQEQEKYDAMIGKNKNSKQNNNLKIAESLEARINSIQSISKQEIIQMEKEAGNDISKLSKVTKSYQERGNYNQAIAVMLKVLDLDPLQYQHYYTLFEYARNNRTDIAVQTIEKAISNYSNLNGNKPPVWVLYYYKGTILFNLANIHISRKSQEKPQILSLLKSAQQSFYNFQNGYNNATEKNNDLRQQSNISEKTLEKIEELIKMYQ